jgi:hypothetical protein
VDRINYFAEGRALEWVLALSMLLLAGEALIWPDTLRAAAFNIVLLVLSSRSIGVLLLMLGWAKAAGLMLNGQKVAGFPAGPYIRAITSALSAIMWSQFALALLRVSIERGRPSVVMPFFFMFALGELYVAYTTVKNA